MGRELRRGKRVYYRKGWVPDPEARGGGRVRSIYCGSGERGELAAREDEERRAACRKASEKVAESPASEVQNAPPVAAEILPPDPTARATPDATLAHAPASPAPRPAPAAPSYYSPQKPRLFAPRGTPSRFRQLLLENERRRLRGG